MTSMRVLTSDRLAIESVVTEALGLRYHDAGAMTSRPAPAVYLEAA
jgi:hypothetical protein